MKIKIIPSREVLDFEIYDLGLIEALKKWELTIEQADRILFAKPIKITCSMTTDELLEYEEKLLNKRMSVVLNSSDNLSNTYTLIIHNYKGLRKIFCLLANVRTINKHSLTCEDTFHNVLIDICQNNYEVKNVAHLTALIRLRSKAARDKVIRDKNSFCQLFEDSNNCSDANN